MTSLPDTCPPSPCADSCDPNLAYQTVFTRSAANTLLYYQALFALQTIPRGAELTYGGRRGSIKDRGRGVGGGSMKGCIVQGEPLSGLFVSGRLVWGQGMGSCASQGWAVQGP